MPALGFTDGTGPSRVTEAGITRLLPTTRVPTGHKPPWLASASGAGRQEDQPDAADTVRRWSSGQGRRMVSSWVAARTVGRPCQRGIGPPEVGPLRPLGRGAPPRGRGGRPEAAGAGAQSGG